MKSSCATTISPPSGTAAATSAAKTLTWFPHATSTGRTPTRRAKAARARFTHASPPRPSIRPSAHASTASRVASTAATGGTPAVAASRWPRTAGKRASAAVTASVETAAVMPPSVPPTRAAAKSHPVGH